MQKRCKSGAKLGDRTIDGQVFNFKFCRSQSRIIDSVRGCNGGVNRVRLESGISNRIKLISFFSLILLFEIGYHLNSTVLYLS